MQRPTAFVVVATLVAALAFQPAFADDWRRHDALRGFRDHGFDHWRAGRWFNGLHEGRNGWWWIVDGLWYFYPAPVYPYPDPYVPSTVVVETTPVPAGVQAYYYCANPAGYYPDVPQCAMAWQRVVSAPGGAPPPQPVPAPQPVPQPPPQAPNGAGRDADMRQLNAYAAALQHIDNGDGAAGAKLKDLEKRVEAFRQSLYQRDYNAMDVLRDAEDLKNRIEAQRRWLAKHKDAAPVAPPPN